MGAELFWLLSFCGFAAMSLACGLLAWPQLFAAWPSIEERIDRFRRQPPLAKVVLLVFVIGFIAYGSTKTNQVDQASGTNEVEIVGGGGQTNLLTCAFGLESDDILLCPPPPLYSTSTVTPADIARGWQLWEVKTNCNISYATPESAAFATNWWVRGAFEDVNQFDFGEWRFPFGSNGYSSVWALTWGKLRFALADTNTEIVAVGAPMSAVPYRSRLWSAADTNGSRLVTWENFALNRDTNTPVNAQIELRSTGDFIVRSNEVETVYHYIDDFDLDGDGLIGADDGDPFFFNGYFCGQSEMRRAEIDRAVGVGLQNGYYKLVVTVPTGCRRTLITVGADYLVADRAGEYVFLLEKGLEYNVDIEPFSSRIDFDVFDDANSFQSMMRRILGAYWSDWTTDGGILRFERPTYLASGWLCWLPTFHVTPSISHFDQDNPSGTYNAVLSDFAFGTPVSYQWGASDPNVYFSAPNSETTEIGVSEMPNWGSGTISVTATFGTNELVSSCHFSYGQHRQPEVHLELDVPNALLLNSNRADTAKLSRVYVSFRTDVETNGTLTLNALAGGDKIGLPSSQSWPVSDGVEQYIQIEGVRASEAVSDVRLEARFDPDGGGEGLSVVKRLTVVQVNDLSIPNEPADGLVVLRDEAVPFDLDVKPSEARALLTTLYSVRRLRADGSYTDWNYAALNTGGTLAVYYPQEGGIYQVRALAGVDMSAAADERYYRWNADEDLGVGIRRKGDLKAFGVCDDGWQVLLRNCARRYMGSQMFALMVPLGGEYGFSGIGEKRDKCNYFVAYVIREVGLPLTIQHVSTLFGNTYPPTANEWANGSQIPHWQHLGGNVCIQPGYVMGHPAGRHGHCGFVDFDGAGISAGSVRVKRTVSPWNDGTTGFNKIGE